jgi:hypothetical protein
VTRRRSAPAAEAADAAYFQAIERHFVSRRGDPLFLSTADWDLIWRWHRAAIPLRVVLRGIDDAFEWHAHSWGRKRKVGSLRYCAAEVERAREKWRRALRMDRTEQLGAQATLEGLARSYRVEAPASVRPSLQDVAQALEERSRAPGDDLPEWLQRLEAMVVARLEEQTEIAVREDLFRQAEEALARYRGRMPPRTFARVVREAAIRRLFEHHGLPRLSLL